MFSSGQNAVEKMGQAERERVLPRIGFIGVEHWHAGMHAEAAIRAGATILAAWSADPVALAAFAARHGGRAAGDLADLLALAPDLVVVMGRPFEIADRLSAAMAAGIPALTEKPVGISAARIAPLLELQARQNAFVAVALPHGYGMLAQLAALGGGGRLGPLSHSHFHLINGPPRRYVDDGVAWVLDPAIGGGGALRNLGIHGVNAFLTLAGDRKVDIERASFGRRIHGTEVEDYAAISLRAADGMLGIVEAGYTYAAMTGGLYAWRVCAKNATLVDHGDRITIATLDDGASRDAVATPPSRRYEDLMNDVLARLAAGQGPAVGLRECWRAMDVIDRCYALAREKT